MNSSVICNKDNISAKGIYPYLDQSIQHGSSERIFVYEILESTNKTAKEAVLNNVEHGTVIIADSQTAGKGRFGKSFYSPPKHGLYMSLIINSKLLPFNTQTLTTAFTAVSVCDAIEAATGKSPSIKWANDIFFNEKKICGILTESVTDPQDNDSRWIIIGIGINFNTPAANFPKELHQTAGSLFESECPSITRNQLAAEIINRIFTSDYRHDEKELIDRYKKRMFILGEEIMITEARESYKALAVDIDNNGYLIVRKNNGEHLSLLSGEIRHGASVAVAFCDTSPG